MLVRNQYYRPKAVVFFYLHVYSYVEHNRLQFLKFFGKVLLFSDKQNIANRQLEDNERKSTRNYLLSQKKRCPEDSLIF